MVGVIVVLEPGLRLGLKYRARMASFAFEGENRGVRSACGTVERDLLVVIFHLHPDCTGNDFVGDWSGRGRW